MQNEVIAEWHGQLYPAEVDTLYQVAVIAKGKFTLPLVNVPCQGATRSGDEDRVTGCAAHLSALQP